MVDMRLASVFAAVFDVEPGDLAEDASVDTLAGWDSVTHIQLILALEEEFDVHFDAGEIASLVSVATIQARLAGGPVGG